MLGTVGLWRAVVHRSRADRLVVAAAFVLLLSAVSLLATGALYGDTVALGGLRQAVLAAPPADRSVVVRTSATPAEVAALDATVTQELTTALGSSGGEVALVGRSGSLAPVGLTTEEARGHLTLLASYGDLAEHATLVEGRWAEASDAPLEASLSEGAAAALGLRIGDRVRLSRGLGATQIVEVSVVGLWRPEADDPYWLGDTLELSGVRQDAQLTTRGPFVVAAADLIAADIDREVDLEWRALPAIDGLRVDRIDALRGAVENARTRIRAVVPPPRQITVATKLPTILADVSRSILVARSAVILLTAQFAVLAGYAVLLVGGLLIERRRAEAALLRSRGATSGHLVALAFGEAVLLAIPAMIVAPFLAVGLVRLVGASGPLAASGVVSTVGVGDGVMTVSALAGLASILVLTLPSLVSDGSPAGVRAALGRQVGRTMAQRLGIDLVLVVVAVIALWQLRLYGAPITRNARGVLGVDPLLVAAPAIGLLAGAVLATRLVPRLAEIGERTLGRRRGLVLPLGARQLARRPLRYTRSALLLILATALGTFAAASSATWARSQVDQAGYQAAGDARVVVSDYPELPAWAFGSAYRGRARRDRGDARLAPIARRRPSRTGRPAAGDRPGRGRRDRHLPAGRWSCAGSARRARRSPPDDRWRHAGRPTKAAGPDHRRRPEREHRRDRRHSGPARLAGDLGGGRPERWRRAAAADRRRCHGSQRGRHDRGRLVGTVGELPVEPVYPLRLEAVELGVTSPPDLIMVGSLELRGVSISQTLSGGAADSLTPVAFDPAAPGWTWTRTDAERTTVYRPPAGTPGRLEIGLGDETSGSLFGSFGGPGATFRLVADPSGDGSIAAIAGDRLLALTGAHVGDTIAVSSAAERLSVRIVGRAATFPPLDPNVAFLVVDGASLDQAAFSATSFPAVVKEWWLSADDSRVSAVAATLAERPYSATTVIRRTALAEDLAGDPIWLGVVGVLALGSLAAIVFAVIGFVVSATVSTGERLGELALLRALGLSGRQLSAWLTLEQVFLLAVGLVGGSALGQLLAWLVLPYATLSPTGASVVPAPVVVVPWEIVLPVEVGLATGLIAFVLALARQVPESRLTRVLRAGEG